MGRRADNRRYVVQRTLVILLMGCKCHYCPERRPEKLEFHHKFAPRWSPTKTSRCMRIRRYLRDWLDKELVLACGRCNKRQGAPPPRKGEHVEKLPF